jgi:hypothetical protein
MVFSRGKLVSRKIIPVFLAAYLGVIGNSCAAVYFSVIEKVDGVYVTMQGALDISPLYLRNGQANQGRLGSGIVGSFAIIGTGDTLGGMSNADVYLGLTSFPSSFGTGGGFTATTGSPNSTAFLVRGGPCAPDNVGCNSEGSIMVPTGYRSGQALLGESFYSGATLASLGLNTGEYVFLWASDKVVVQIGEPVVPVVPLPAALPLFLSALITLGGVAWLGRFRA